MGEGGLPLAEPPRPAADASMSFTPGRGAGENMRQFRAGARIGVVVAVMLVALLARRGADPASACVRA